MRASQSSDIYNDEKHSNTFSEIVDSSSEVSHNRSKDKELWQQRQVEGDLRIQLSLQNSGWLLDISSGGYVANRRRNGVEERCHDDKSYNGPDDISFFWPVWLGLYYLIPE